MKRCALITTTINVPENLREWSKTLDPERDVIVVAGDIKTPHDEVRHLLDELPIPSHYLDPRAMPRSWQSDIAIGYDSVQRRNLALLEALLERPRFIITIDDDNYPLEDDHVDYVEGMLGSRRRTLISSDSNWYDVGGACVPQVTHRGYPLPERRRDRHGKVAWYNSPIRTVNVGVHASLWLGDPDVDAVERLVLDLVVHSVEEGSTTLDLVTWCPFNSQATAYLVELAPLMFVWPSVGRYDDIWASYLARRVMDRVGAYASYGAPIVRQERNEHDLLRDLELELLGYRHTPRLCEVLRSVELEEHDDVVAHMRVAVSDLLRYCDFIPYETANAFEAWLNDVEQVRRSTNLDFIWR